MAHFLIVCANYYEDIADELVLGAKSHLEIGGHTHELIHVPGAFELPAAIHYAIHCDTKVYDGYIALGCVIRGETAHFDYVCGECARGIQHLALHHNAAVGFGVLTVENKQQAQKRASVNGGNKGREAAEAAMQLVALKEKFGVTPA